MISKDLTVSVVVPTFNRREPLRRLLNSLERQHQRGARFETVVVIDGSDDGTEAVLTSLRPSYPLRAIFGPRRGAAAARNVGIAAAMGEVLLFLDDDVVSEDGLFERHLAIHAEDPLAAVTGKMAAPTGHAQPAWLDWEATMLERNYARVVAGRGGPGWWLFYTANASVRREQVIGAGGFDERFERVEDNELAYRLAARGLHFYFLPDAVVRHEPDRTFEAWLHVASVSGKNRVLLEERIGLAGASNIREDWRRRHRLTRALATLCVGHTNRTRFVVGALGRVIRGRLAPRKPRLLLCSAVYNVLYWNGVAKAMGLGSELWHRFVQNEPGLIAAECPNAAKS